MPPIMNTYINQSASLFVKGKESKQDRELSEVIRALGRLDFPDVLNHFVAQVVAFDNLIILVYHKNHNPHVLYRQYKDPIVYQTMDSQYVKAAYLLDPFYQAALNGIQSGVYSLMELAPDQYKKSRYFREYYRDTTLVDEFAIFSRLGHDTTLTACFGRDHTSKQKFTKNELQRVKRFAFTLSALCEHHWRDYVPVEGKNITLPPITERLQCMLEKKHAIHLSPRQAEVALFILQGHSSLSIALHLNLSKETVKVFRKQLYARCKISSQAELFALLMPIFSLL